MDKVPVFEIFGETYGFAFKRYLSLLGVLWLPMFLLGALAYLMFAPMLAIMPGAFAQMAQHAKDPQAAQAFAMQMNAFAGRSYLFDIIEIVLIGIMATGVVKEVLGRRTGPAFVYLSVNQADLLVIGGFFLLVVLYFAYLIALAIVGAIAGGIFGFALGGAKDQTSMMLGFGGTFALVMIIGVLAAIFFAVRLGFLMVAVSVAENRFGLWRSWQLTRGNFWRIIGLVLIVFLPVLVVEWILLGVVMLPAMSEAVSTARHAGSDQAGAVLGQFFMSMGRYFPYFWGAAMLISPITMGLMFAPGAFAWRALQGDVADTFGERPHGQLRG